MLRAPAAQTLHLQDILDFHDFGQREACPRALQVPAARPRQQLGPAMPPHAAPHMPAAASRGAERAKWGRLNAACLRRGNQTVQRSTCRSTFSILAPVLRLNAMPIGVPSEFKLRRAPPPCWWLKSGAGTFLRWGDLSLCVPMAHCNTEQGDRGQLELPPPRLATSVRGDIVYRCCVGRGFFRPCMPPRVWHLSGSPQSGRSCEQTPPTDLVGRLVPRPLPASCARPRHRRVKRAGSLRDKS